MYERSTDHRESKKAKEIYTAAEAPNIEGMGVQWQRDRGYPQVSDSFPYPVPLEQGAGIFLSGKRRRIDPGIECSS